ncbi:MAG: hypothetical protein LBT05_07175, partial [Planctomycetaceae bacterium]|nr:hypothetical protein [Planctomycetaceae bacterium]
TTPRSPESSLRRQWRDCVVQQTDPRKITFLMSLVRNVCGISAIGKKDGEILLPLEGRLSAQPTDGAVDGS